MPYNLSVDIISDLNLKSTDELKWDDKPTSLLCVIAGGLSSDLQVISSTIEKLSTLYKGVFYIEGPIEHRNILDYENTIRTISGVCSKYNNVVYLHQHVVIFYDVAFVGINGWSTANSTCTTEEHDILIDQKLHDMAYLSNTLKHLQSNKNVNKIVIVSSCVPDQCFLYNDYNSISKFEPAMTLLYDENNLVKTWLFSGSQIATDVTLSDRRFVNNPRYSKSPYWPKRVEI